MTNIILLYPFRSQAMDLYKLQCHKDSEWQVMHVLGKMGLAHLVDLMSDSPPTDLPYTDTIKQLEGAERTIR